MCVDMEVTKSELQAHPLINTEDHGVVLEEMFTNRSEEWRFAKSRYGAESTLLVSSMGRIVGLPYRSRPCNGTAWHLKFKKGNKQKYGHVNVSWADLDSTRDNSGRLKMKRDFIHQIVARTFLGPPVNNDVLVRHRNGNPGDNRVDNLIWGNRGSNMSDKLSRPDSMSVEPKGLFVGAALQRRIESAIDGETDPVEVLKEIRNGINEVTSRRVSE